METYSEILDETIITGRLQNGLNYYIIPKEDYNEKRALLTVKYGSADEVFKSGGRLFETPLGTAHFLEHKLFDNEQGSAFESFSRLGSFVNAFTSFNNTAYYFSCERDFEKNLDTLLDFVSKPYFTKLSVEKEMGIIRQEISMYDDNPGWASYFDMLSCLYERHPAKNSIAGTAESISEITPETLHKCYESFYVPENMYLICVGGLKGREIEGIAEIAEKYWGSGRKRAETVMPEESGGVNRAKSVRSFETSRAVFQIGFKQRRFDDQLGTACALKIALDLFIGESSGLMERLVNERLADETLSFDNVYGEGFGYAIVAGESRSPGELLEKCVEMAREIEKRGFDEKDFERLKKKHIGRFVRGFNSVEAVMAASAEYAVKSASLFDCFNEYKATEVDRCNSLISEMFREGGFALSVLEPGAGNA